MFRTVLLATVLALSLGCKGSKHDPVVTVGASDPEIDAAMAEARRRWPELVSAFREHAGERFAVKYPFPRGPRSVEHVWIAVTAIDEDRVTGTIDNEPVGKIGHELGETVTVPSKDISDWLYHVKGKKDPVGGFTVKVLLARQKQH